MTTAPADPLARPTQRLPLRVSVREATTDRIGGAWWPQSRDLWAEVADLVGNFPDREARIVRLLYSRSDWVSTVPDGQPVREVLVDGDLVKVGSLARGGRGTVVLMLATGVRLRLRVIASNADPVTAAGQLGDVHGPGGSSPGEARSPGRPGRMSRAHRT